MKRPLLLPFALSSILLLAACGTRSSLPEPADCGPWSVRDGAPGTVHGALGPFAVLDDGSVVVPLSNAATDPGGKVDEASAEHRVRRLDPDGEVAWDAMGGPGVVAFTAVARDAADGILVAGVVQPGTPSVLGTTLACPGKEACTILGKLTETGKPAWFEVVSSGARAWPMGLAWSGDGRITLEGAFDGTIDLGCGPLTGTAGGWYGSRYLAQLSPSGECLWSRAILGTPLLGAPDDHIAVDDQGDVALALLLLATSDGATVDLGGGPVPFTYGPGLAVAKYAPSGDLVFAKVVSDGSAKPWSHVAVTDAGEVLLSASYEGTIDLGGGPRGSAGTVRQFVTKFDAKGEELWTRDIAAGPSSEGTPANPFPLALASDGDFFLAGPGRSGMSILGVPVPETTLFTAAYDAEGKPLDVQTFPLTKNVYPEGLSASADGALVLVGAFDGTLDFGQGPLASEGTRDAFVARICR